jgi:hypothetical protein
MYVLILITIVNGGMGTPIFQEYRNLTKQQCEVMKKQKETETKIGYCERQKDEH